MAFAVNCSAARLATPPCIAPTRVQRRSTHSLVTCASNGDNPFGPASNGPSTSTKKPAPSAADVQAKEAQLELLEAGVRGNQRAQASARKIKIKGMVNTDDKDAASNMAPWAEGSLFPEGWDQMPLPQKMTELYMGRRGVLFWANKAAYASVFILIGGWVLFRFVGPNLGLYNLQGELVPPPF